MKETTGGFIALHRSIQSHWIWTDPIRFQWWVDILLQVNHAPQKVLVKGVLIDCGRGQSVRSLQEWGIRWKVSKDCARTFLLLLVKDGMISLENLTKTTRLTVCNYGSYQDLAHAGPTRSKRSANAEPTLADTNNKDNNDNKDNNENNTPVADAPGREEKTAHWKLLVGAWFDFYEKKFGAQPNFSKADRAALRQIAKALRARSEPPGKPGRWDERFAPFCLSEFLKRAHGKSDWLRENFRLPILSSHFDAIINHDPTNRTHPQQPADRDKPGTSTGRTEALKHW